MNPIDIERLLRQPEGQFLERKACFEYFKGRWKLRKARDVARDVVETLSAFDNADVGTLLLGVDDDGNVSGVDFPENKLGVIKNAPTNLIKPPLRANINEILFQGKRLFLFTVNWMPDVYELTDCFVRSP